MSFFTTKTQTVEIDGENSVVVRALTYGEEINVKRQCMKMRAGMDGQGEMTFDAMQLQLLTLQTAIVSWSGPEFDGRPVTPENIEALPSAVLDPVIEAINEVGKPLSDEEKN